MSDSLHQALAPQRCHGHLSAPRPQQVPQKVGLSQAGGAAARGASDHHSPSASEKRGDAWQQRVRELGSLGGDPEKDMDIIVCLVLFSRWAKARSPPALLLSLLAVALILINFVCVLVLAVFGAPTQSCGLAAPSPPSVGAIANDTLRLSTDEIFTLCYEIRPPPYLDRCYIHSIDVLDVNATRYFLPVVVDFRSLPKDLFGPSCLANCTNETNFRDFLDQAQDHATKFVRTGNN